jgi:hypothetical protein
LEKPPSFFRTYQPNYTTSCPRRHNSSDLPSPQLHISLFSSKDDDTMIKSQRFRRIKHVECMKKRRNIDKVCQNTLGVTKCLGSKPGDNIKVHLKDMILKDEK